MNSYKLSIFSLAVLCMAVFLSACSGNNPWRELTADRLGSAAFMVKRDIPAGPFALRAYERMHERGQPANVYIEGDGSVNEFGDTFLKQSTIWQQNDPQTPLALHLATRDKAENLAYLARPCQYSGMLDEEASCDPKYFTSEAYSGEVIAAYNEALDKMKNRYSITTFNLIGFEGGGTIAAILAATRSDVVSLRTVAANLDHEVFARHNNQQAYSNSMNAIDFAQRLRRMPQVHFVGGKDEEVPVSIIQSYAQALGPTNCVKIELIQEAQHKSGWADKWPELLAVPPSCRGPMKEITRPMADILPEASVIRRELPEKP